MKNSVEMISCCWLFSLLCFYFFAPSRKFQSSSSWLFPLFFLSPTRNLFLSNRCCPELLTRPGFILRVFLHVIHSHPLQFSNKKIDRLLITFCQEPITCFCFVLQAKPVIGPWALRENNALLFSDTKPIRARVISPTKSSHIIMPR